MDSYLIPIPKSQMLLNQIQPLPISNEHVWLLKQLPLHHHDPFDRMIIAQAISEGLTIVTQDAQFAAYPVAIFSSLG
ncbi:MAG: type II toxin-antitoxin system VapC family toxin [Chloroflexota bacterium]